MDINQYIGNEYVFTLACKKSKRIDCSGVFVGIGECDEYSGMIFMNVKIFNRKLSNSTCLLIHPKFIKCTLKQNIINLRRKCRKILNNNEPKCNRVYFSLKKVEKVPNHEM